MKVIGVAMNANSPPPVNKRPLRRALQAFSVLVVFVLCCFIVMAFIPPKQLLVENFPQVRIGMTLAEVETLLGGPPGHYFRDTVPVFASSGFNDTPPIGAVRKTWTDETNLFEIDFDIHDRVTGYRQSRLFGTYPAPGNWRRIRLWIRDTTGF